MNIYESIANIMQESVAIGKEKLNKQQGFKYRGIDDVMNTFYPLLSKHKVFVAPEVLEQLREERITKNGGNLIYSILKIKYTFYAEDGTNISAVVIGEGMDSADKASNKAMAVGMKYAMFQVFCIPTEDMPDPDGDTPPTTTKKKVEKEEPKEVPFEEVEQPMTLEQAKAVAVVGKDGNLHKVQDMTEEELLFFTTYNKRPDLMEASKLELAERARLANEQRQDS